MKFSWFSFTTSIVVSDYLVFELYPNGESKAIAYISRKGEKTIVLRMTKLVLLLLHELNLNTYT